MKSRPATASASTTFALWPSCSATLRGARSAITPPMSESETIGMALTSPITPRAANEPVRS